MKIPYLRITSQFFKCLVRIFSRPRKVSKLADEKERRKVRVLREENEEMEGGWLPLEKKTPRRRTCRGINLSLRFQKCIPPRCIHWQRERSSNRFSTSPDPRFIFFGFPISITYQFPINFPFLLLYFHFVLSHVHRTGPDAFFIPRTRTGYDKLLYRFVSYKFIYREER